LETQSLKSALARTRVVVAGTKETIAHGDATVIRTRPPEGPRVQTNDPVVMIVIIAEENPIGAQLMTKCLTTQPQMAWGQSAPQRRVIPTINPSADGDVAVGAVVSAGARTAIQRRWTLRLKSIPTMR
jgi:hypothetical protein